MPRVERAVRVAGGWGGSTDGARVARRAQPAGAHSNARTAIPAANERGPGRALRRCPFEPYGECLPRGMSISEWRVRCCLAAWMRNPGGISLAELAAPANIPQPAGIHRRSPHLSNDALHILLVDDHDESLFVMARLLERFGHSVDTARTYAEAMEAARRRRCDLLISDVGLPDRSGLELMQELRLLYSVKGIALSGFTAQRDALASRDAGFARHLNKPVVFTEVIEAIREVAGWHPPAGPAANGAWRLAN